MNRVQLIFAILGVLVVASMVLSMVLPAGR